MALVHKCTLPVSWQLDGRALPLWMDLILKQVKPVQGIEYFVEYFRTAALVHQGDPLVLAKFRSVGLVMVGVAAHFLYQYCIQMDHFEQIMHGDYAGISNIRHELYLFIDAIIFLSLYFFYLLYFPHSDAYVLRLLRSIMIEQRNDFFGLTHYNNMPVCDYIRRFAVRVLNILQGFVLIIDTFVITSQIVSMYDLFQYDPSIWKSFGGIVLMLLLEVRLLALYISLFMFAHSHILLATLWIVSLKVFAIKLKHLGKPPITRQLGNISYFLNRFRLEITHTLLIILRVNRLFSKVLVLFMLINCPMNCLLVCSLIVGRIPGEKIVFVGPVSMEGFVFIFGIHMMTASVNKKIHSPSKQFIRLNLYNKFCKLKYRVKLDNFIHTFHTRRRYGFTYYLIGLISMFTFVKYLILYSEFLMFVYKSVL